MTIIESTVVKHLEETARKIRAGDSTFTEEEGMEIISAIASERLNKVQSCSYLNLSRSRFDTLIREGKIPKGKHSRGENTLMWKKSDLDKAIIKSKTGNS